MMNQDTRPAYASIDRRSKKSGPLFPPFSILWSPLQPITCIFPFIGHTGITDSKGVASDFQGHYTVGDNSQMAFGMPTRYYRLDRDGEIPGGAEAWDKNIEDANEVYRKRLHNIFCDNCHSHVANVLNRSSPPLWRMCSGKFSIVNIAILMFFQGRFFFLRAALPQFAPIIIIVLLWILF